MRRLRPTGAAGLLAVIALGPGACGYSVRGTLPEHIQTVAVPVFANHTSEPAVENFITRAVVEAFSTSGRLRVVTPERADALLEGEITGYELVSVAFDPGANVRVYRLVVTMNLRFRDVRENKVLFQRAGLQERADFRVPGAVSETLVREQAALRTAAIDIGRAVVSLALERF
ncbi:MAG: LPS assembly lipoprotein LptE [Candidatus Rokuibacteriota bacterium]